MKFSVTSVMFLGFLFLGGCKSFYSPSDVLELALGALQENNMEEFTSTLTGPALGYYSNVQNIEALRQRLSMYKKFETDNLRKLSTQRINSNLSVTTYTVDVLGFTSSEDLSQHVGTATTSCTTKSKTEYRAKSADDSNKITTCLISEFR